MRQDLSINLFQLYLLSALSFYNKSVKILQHSSIIQTECVTATWWPWQLPPPSREEGCRSAKKNTNPPYTEGIQYREMAVVLQNSSNAKLDSQYHMMAIRPISTLLVRLTVFSNKDFDLAAKYQRWASTLAKRSNARHGSNIRALPRPPQMYVSKVWESVGPEGRKRFIANWGLRMSHICPCTPCPSLPEYGSKVESRHFAHLC